MNRPIFSSILKRVSSTIEKPVPMPVGQYHCMTVGLPKQDVSSRKQTPYVEFTLKIIEALGTVDKEALAASLKGKKLSERTLKATYYLTEDASFRLIQFLNNLEAGDEDMTVEERIAESQNKEVIVTVRHEVTDDNETVFARVGSTAKVSSYEEED